MSTRSPADLPDTPNQSGTTTPAELQLRRLALQWLPGTALQPGETAELAGYLPADELLSPALLGELVTARHGQNNAVLFLNEHGPVALIPIRQVGNGWTLVTGTTVPGVIGLLAAEHMGAVLDGIGLDLRVTWWQQPGLPPASPAINGLIRSPTHRIDLSEDFEGWWKQSGQWGTIKRSRKRCQAFEILVNPPGGAEWVIRQWADKWSVHPAEIEDRLIIARHLELAGKFQTLVVRDGSRWVAGETLVERAGTLCWGVCFRDGDYDKQGVGTRAMDFAFYWARELGYRAIDLGGTRDYKQRWAPTAGERFEFTLRPGWRARADHSLAYAQAMHSTLWRRMSVSAVTACATASSSPGAGLVSQLTEF